MHFIRRPHKNLDQFLHVRPIYVQVGSFYFDYPSESQRMVSVWGFSSPRSPYFRRGQAHVSSPVSGGWHTCCVIPSGLRGGQSHISPLAQQGIRLLTRSCSRGRASPHLVFKFKRRSSARLLSHSRSESSPHVHTRSRRGPS